MLERDRWIQGLSPCGAGALLAAFGFEVGWGIAVAQDRFHRGRWRKAAGEGPPHTIPQSQSYFSYRIDFRSQPRLLRSSRLALIILSRPQMYACMSLRPKMIPG